MSNFIKRQRFLLLFLCICLCTAFSVGKFNTRTLPHVDEVWSYMLSNKTDSPFLFAFEIGVGAEMDDLNNFTQSKNAYFNHWHDPNYYHNAITVQRGEQFLYDRVYYNQTLDVHPPLYYYILHTICSFFPDKFSWWYAFSINIVFYLGTLIMIFAIAKKLGMDDTNALIAVLFWGISASGTNEVCFLRMYMMLTFFIMCITYLYICMVQDFSVKYAIAVFILNILSFLTQYYAYIFVFFITLFYTIYLMYKRKVLRSILYGFAVLGSVGIAVLIFPAMYKHIFSGFYSPKVTYGDHSSIYSSFTETLQIVIESYTGFNIDCFFLLPVILILLFCGHIIIMLIRLNKKEKITVITSDQLAKISKYIFRTDMRYLRLLFQKLGNTSCKLVFFSMLSASVFIINVSPNMGTLTVRYLFLLMPLFSVFAVLYSQKIFAGIFKNKKKILTHINVFQLLLYSAFILRSQVVSESSLFIKNQNDNNIYFKDFFENSSIILVDSTHHTQALTPFLLNTHSVYPAEKISDQLGSVIADYDDHNSPMYLIISPTKGNKKVIENSLNKNISANYSYIGDYYFSTDFGAYYIYQIIE